MVDPVSTGAGEPIIVTAPRPAETSDSPATNPNVSLEAAAVRTAFLNASPGQRLVSRSLWQPGGGSDAGGTYRYGDVVYYNGGTFISLADGNAGIPDSASWVSLGIQTISDITEAHVITGDSALAQAAPPHRRKWWSRLAGELESGNDPDPSTGAWLSAPKSPSVSLRFSGNSAPAQAEGATAQRATSLPERKLPRALEWLVRGPAYKFEEIPAAPVVGASAEGPVAGATPPLSPAVTAPKARKHAEPASPAAPPVLAAADEQPMPPETERVDSSRAKRPGRFRKFAMAVARMATRVEEEQSFQSLMAEPEQPLNAARSLTNARTSAKTPAAAACDSAGASPCPQTPGRRRNAPRLPHFACQLFHVSSCRAQHTEPAAVDSI